MFRITKNMDICYQYYSVHEPRVNVSSKSRRKNRSNQRKNLGATIFIPKMTVSDNWSPGSHPTDFSISHSIPRRTSKHDMAPPWNSSLLAISILTLWVFYPRSAHSLGEGQAVADVIRRRDGMNHLARRDCLVATFDLNAAFIVDLVS